MGIETPQTHVSWKIHLSCSVPLTGSILSPLQQTLFKFSRGKLTSCIYQAQKLSVCLVGFCLFVCLLLGQGLHSYSWLAWKSQSSCSFCLLSSPNILVAFISASKVVWIIKSPRYHNGKKKEIWKEKIQCAKRKKPKILLLNQSAIVAMILWSQKDFKNHYI